MTLRVQVVSPEHEVWSGQARMVSATTVEGSIGILTGHEPVIAVLGDGEVRVDAESGEGVTAMVEGGFLSVDHDTVLVVAERVSTGSGGGGAGGNTGSAGGARGGEPR